MDDFQRNRETIARRSWLYPISPEGKKILKTYSRRHARHNLKEQDRATLKKYRAIRF